jgi:N-acetylneuraminic acid mutarotase
MKKIFSLVLVLSLCMACVSLAVEDTWTPKADMPTRRYVVSSSVVDGKIYAIGGDAGNRASRVEAYDPLTDTWTRKADMPIAEGAGGCSAVNGKIYVIGGTFTPYGAPRAAVQEYDVATDTWTTKAALPTARAWLSSSVVNGKIYAIGGTRTYQGTPLSTVEEYDPATDTWTKKADMPTPRGCVSTSAVNGKIYAIGGTPCNPWYQGLSTVEEYDPATDTWTKKADMSTGRTYISTCAVNGKIYAIGGVESHGSDHVAPVEEYDPVTDTWTTKADMPTARSGLATSAVNGKIYAIGGWVGGGTSVSTVEEYDMGLTISSLDFNGDGIVDSMDICIMVEHWQEDYPSCDIAPRPFGDGVVDTQDLIVLSEYLFEDINDSTLVSHWAFDETEGMTVADSAGDNNGYAIGDPVWQPDGGLVNGALQLDGVDDCVITGAPQNPADGSFSILAWINGGAPGQVIMSQQGVANWLMSDDEGNLITELKGIERSAGPLQSQTVITDGHWHRVGFVWDGTNRILYVDDVAVAEDTQDGLGNSESGLYIGTGTFMQPETYFSGMIDDIRIYNRAVTP